MRTVLMLPLRMLAAGGAALTWLKRMVDDRASMSWCLWFHSTHEPLRADGRFQALVREVAAQRK